VRVIGGEGGESTEKEDVAGAGKGKPMIQRVGKG